MRGRFIFRIFWNASAMRNSGSIILKSLVGAIVVNSGERMGREAGNCASNGTVGAGTRQIADGSG